MPFITRVLIISMMLYLPFSFGQVPDKEKELIERAIPLDAHKKADRVRKILVLSKSFGFKHKSTEYGDYALQKIADKTGAFSFTFSEDVNDYSLENLKKFDAVFLNNNTGIEKFLSTEKQQREFEQYVREGGGIIGVHAASDGGWENYIKLIGGRFAGHPWGGGKVWSFVNEDSKCACTDHYPELFKFQ
ncbi:MAG: ThuA domain-containing protein, partial [Lentisphaeraceae bacterium]|nr:ThuA domain-containing protein [Lentisphaeraceae bacterium]